jgi:hypothetical protein
MLPAKRGAVSDPVFHVMSPPSNFSSFIHGRNAVTAIMKFSEGNMRNSRRQIQHNEYLIGISKDPLKPVRREKCRCRRVVCLGVLDTQSYPLIKQQLCASFVVAAQLSTQYSAAFVIHELIYEENWALAICL